MEETKAVCNKFLPNRSCSANSEKNTEPNFLESTSDNESWENVDEECVGCDCGGGDEGDEGSSTTPSKVGVLANDSSALILG